jgi:hypothetical protein
MISPCKKCIFILEDKNKFSYCLSCKRRWDAVKQWETENPFTVYGDNTPRVNTGDIPQEREPWDR